MDFLDQVYFQNNIRSYLVVAIVIAVAFFIKTFISRYIASLMYIPVKKSCAIDKKIFINLVVLPLESFIVILISVLALERLTFPHQFLINIYHVTTKQIVESGLIAILIISFTSLLLRFMDFIALVIEKRQHSLSQSDNQLIFFLKDFLKVVLVIGSLLFIMKFSFNAHIGQLITGLSIVGAALALAAKESLENLIASFIILFDKPFVAGDLVKINTFEGTIERIGLRSTRLRTIEESLVVVPNKQMVDSILDNYSKRREVRNDLRIEVTAQTTSEKLLSAVEEMKVILENRKEEIISYTVFLTDISKNTAFISVEYFTPYNLHIQKVNSLKQDVHLEIKKMLEKNEIYNMQPNSFTIVNNG